jgi:4-alpha-glucanotransferase
MVGVWLPDGVGDRRPQNLPGTSDEYPNWRLPVAGPDGTPLGLEELTRSARLHALAEDVRRALAEHPSPEAAAPPAPAREAVRDAAG